MIYIKIPSGFLHTYYDIIITGIPGTKLFCKHSIICDLSAIVDTTPELGEKIVLEITNLGEVRKICVAIIISFAKLELHH